MLKLLHVGCGPQSINSLPKFSKLEWEEIRFDIDPSVNPDIIGTLTDMSNVDDSSVDAVYSSHNIEHVYPHEINTVFSEFLRVLKPTGFLCVTCPDLHSVAQSIIANGLETALYLSPAGPITPLDILYGHIDSIKNGNLYMAHKTGFTWESLKSKLHGEGFSMVYGGQYPENFSLKAVAYKAMQSEEFVINNSLKYLP
jgi:ubiquinone/menaquinone biosynthesis C-methylase UbiE